MRAYLLVTLLIFATCAVAQSSGNATCADAYPVLVSTGATPDTWIQSDLEHQAAAISPVVCTGSGYRDAWYSFVAAGSSHTIVHDGSGPSPFQIEAFSGSCGALTSLGCSDAAVTGWALPLTGLTPGSIYRFRVYTINTTIPDLFVGVGVIAGLPNDNCANATVLIPADGASIYALGELAFTVGATQSQAGCVVAAASDDDVWFRFTATASKHTVLLTTQDAVVVEAFSGACGSLTSLWCEDAWVASGDLTGLTVGQEVYLRVYSLSTTPGAYASFRISIAGPPANDESANAVLIEVNDGQSIGSTTPFNLTGATATVVGQYPTLRDVWFQFIAPSSAIVFEKTGTFTLSIYDAGGNGLATATTTNPLEATGLTPGLTYLLKAGYSSPMSGGFWSHGITVNDECADAVQLTVQSGTGPLDFTYASTFGATQSATACLGGTNDDVWFHFTATATDVLLRVNPIAVRHELYTGSCGALVSVSCGGVTFGQLRWAGLTVGTDYIFRLWTSSTTQEELLRVALSNVPSNDECAAAIPLIPSTLADYDPDQRTSLEFASQTMPKCMGTPNIANDLWYSFTPTTTSTGLVLQGPVGSMHMQLFSGTCGALVSELCTDEHQANFTDLTPGSTYHARVYTNTGNGSFNHQFYAPPVNDEISGAIQLTPNGSSYAHPLQPFVNYGASMSFPQVTCTGTPANDTWFWFVATGSQHTVGVDVGSLLYAEDAPTMRVETFLGYSTNPDSLLAHELACGSNTANVIGLTAGDTVYVRLFTDALPHHIRTFHPWVSDGGDPDNESGATVIPFYDAYSLSFVTDGATQSLPANACVTLGDNADDDIWFKFVHDGDPATLTCHFLDNNVVTELFSGPVGNLSSMACGSALLVLPATLVQGQTYHLRVYSRNANPLTGKLGLFHTPHPMASECAEVDCLGPNLVLNPSLEQGGLCSPGVTTTDTYPPPGYPVMPNWVSALMSADGFASCADYNDAEHVPFFNTDPQAWDARPRNGGGFGGLYAWFGSGDYHEALCGTLSAPLVLGLPYLIAFNVKLREGFTGCDALGAILSTEPMGYYGYPVHSATHIAWEQGPVVERNGWLTVCGQIIADQPYAYITIGVFKPKEELMLEDPTDQGNQYYFLDDVTVAEVIDVNCLSMDLEELDPEAPSAAGVDGLRVYPNPANDRLNISIEEGIIGDEAVIELFDATGKSVHARMVPSLTNNVMLALPAELREGLYLLMLRTEGREPRSARVVVRL